jgi:hypothetical protein
MKNTILILAVILAVSFATEDAADTLASRFIFKSDQDRRIMVNSLFTSGNPSQVFQLCYGLKRQSLYDTIRAYFHPHIVDIVLFGSYSFYIQASRNALANGPEYLSTDVDTDINLYYLSSHRYTDTEIRDGESTFVNVHSFGLGSKTWRFTPVSSAYAGLGFYIALARDELMYDGVDQTGWYLSTTRLTAFEKTFADRTHLSIHAPPCQSNIWILNPVDRGDAFVMSLSYDDNQFDGINQSGWHLDIDKANDRRSSSLSSFDDSYYVVAVKRSAIAPTRSWRISFAG